MVKRKRDSTVGGGPDVTNQMIRHTVPQFHKLWFACQIVIDPSDEGSTHPRVLQFGLQQSGLDGVKGAGEVEEHNPDLVYQGRSKPSAAGG